MTTPCTCESAAFCPLAGFTMSVREHQLCQTRPDYRRAFRSGHAPQHARERRLKGQPEPAEPPGLGDLVERALSAIGITSDRVSAWIGQPCGCAERKAKLNRLGRWAANLLAGKGSAGELESLIAEPASADDGGPAHV